MHDDTVGTDFHQTSFEMCRMKIIGDQN